MVATTSRNIEETARTAYEVAEAQRDSHEVLGENLAAAQRRSLGLALGLAEDGLRFVRLQEENARAAQEWFAGGVRLLQLRRRNAEFAQGWTGDAVETLREQAEHNLRTAEAIARAVSKQQEGFGALTRAWAGTYRDFLSPFRYFRQGARTFQRASQQGLEATEQLARQGLQATERATRQGLRVAEETTEWTDAVLKQAEKATREAELRTAAFGALKPANYEGLSVDEISGRLDDLSVDELKKVREYEKKNKDRETLIEQIDRKIRANS